MARRWEGTAKTILRTHPAPAAMPSRIMGLLHIIAATLTMPHRRPPTPIVAPSHVCSLRSGGFSDTSQSPQHSKFSDLPTNSERLHFSASMLHDPAL